MQGRTEGLQRGSEPFGDLGRRHVIAKGYDSNRGDPPDVGPRASVLCSGRGLRQALDQDAGDCQKCLRVAGDDLLEALARDLDHPAVADGTDRCAIRLAGDQRHLADRLTPRDLADDHLPALVILDHRRQTAAKQEVAALTRVSLSDQGFPAADLAPMTDRAQLSHGLFVERPEKARQDFRQQAAMVTSLIEGDHFAPRLRRPAEQLVEDLGGDSHQLAVTGGTDGGGPRAPGQDLGLADGGPRRHLAERHLAAVVLDLVGLQAPGEHDIDPVARVTLMEEHFARSQTDVAQTQSQVTPDGRIDMPEPLRLAELIDQLRDLYRCFRHGLLILDSLMFRCPPSGVAWKSATRVRFPPAGGIVRPERSPGKSLRCPWTYPKAPVIAPPRPNTAANMKLITT